MPALAVLLQADRRSSTGSSGTSKPETPWVTWAIVSASEIREGRPVLAARVGGRSSFARCGVLVHFTAPSIHAGFVGTITLEIMNLGPHAMLRPGMKICQLILEQVEGFPADAPSQFHGQRRREVFTADQHVPRFPRAVGITIYASVATLRPLRERLAVAQDRSR
jgi:hypothetical protein